MMIFELFMEVLKKDLRRVEEGSPKGKGKLKIESDN